MRWLTEIFRRDRERGATAVLTALLMVALVGFTGLAVDGSATMAKQQELQNGADAAALAAAQECAENGCAGAGSIADPYGVDNVSNEKPSVSTSFAFDTSAQTVKATVTGTQSHWFLPVVGLDESTIDANATATWGSPKSGPSMLPLSVSMCSFEAAVGDPDLDVVKDVYLPKNGSEDGSCYWGGTYPPGSFGWLTSDCDVVVEIVVDTWVVSDPGADEPSDCDWAALIGDTVLIPVFDDRDPGPPKMVHIEKFAAFELLGIKASNGATQFGEACSYTAPAYDTVRFHKACIRGKFLEYVTSADGYEVGDEDTEVSIIRLID